MTRATAVLVLVLLVLAVWALMLAGWRRRARGQGHLPGLPEVPEDAGAPLAGPADGTYVSTTVAGDWLDRVTARGLGTRSAARMVVTDDGVGWLRQGAPAVWAPAATVEDVRRASGMAGKFVERDGLVVVTWRLGEQPLDTGFRPRAGADAGQLEAAVRALLDGTGARDGTDEGGGR